MMDDNLQQNGLEENIEVDIKMEPHEDDECVDGFVGFDNINNIPSTADVGTLNLWTSKAASCLIAQYKKYHSLVGQTSHIRSLREMFEMISQEMRKFGFYFSPQKCENKWRVLERKYKNLVFRERLKKPGRMRHYGHWEHKKALDEIFNEKQRHMYLNESDFPPPSGSAKLALKSKSLTDSGCPTINQSIEDVHDNVMTASQKTNNQKVPFAVIETFFVEMRKHFHVAEQNKERRHKEEMSMRQKELEIQKKILMLKEQKLQLKKCQISAAAQCLRLNID